MADQPDRTPWTIKSVPVAIRQRATERAKNNDETVGEWIERAVLAQADREANTLVIPPGKPEQTEALPAAPRANRDLAALARAAVEVARLYQAAGLPLPKRVARRFGAMLWAEIRPAPDLGKQAGFLDSV